MFQEMEAKFFTINGLPTNYRYFFSDKPSCFDHLMYQELLSVMLLSQHGTPTELFSNEP